MYTSPRNNIAFLILRIRNRIEHIILIADVAKQKEEKSVDDVQDWQGAKWNYCALPPRISKLCQWRARAFFLYSRGTLDNDAALARSFQID